MEKLSFAHVTSQPEYKLIVPEEVEKKIRLLCQEIPMNEWSGILFYTIKGDFDDKKNPLTVICKDILLMDIGTHTHTRYEYNADIIGYMTDNNLIGDNIFIGHGHSHCNFTAFFSGEDTQQMYDGGKDTNHFVSLIVNNEGKYVAGITRRIIRHTTITGTCQYESWNGKKINKTISPTIQDTEAIEWYDLKVIREVPEQDTVLLDRIKEIRSTVKEEPKQYSLDFKDVPSINIKQDKSKYDTVSDSVIQNIFIQSLTCSMFTSSEKFNLDKWKVSMNAIYTKRFGTTDEFTYFADLFADTLTSQFDYHMVENVIELIIKKFYENKPEEKNIWWDEWINTYSKMI